MTDKSLSEQARELADKFEKVDYGDALAAPMDCEAMDVLRALATENDELKRAESLADAFADAWGEVGWRNVSDAEFEAIRQKSFDRAREFSELEKDVTTLRRIIQLEPSGRASELERVKRENDELRAELEAHTCPPSWSSNQVTIDQENAKLRAENERLKKDVTHYRGLVDCKTHRGELDLCSCPASSAITCLHPGNSE